MIADLFEVMLNRVLERRTRDTSFSDRKLAYLAYKSAWSMRADPKDYDNLLREQLHAHSVPSKYSEVNTEVGNYLHAAFLAGQRPKHVKNYLL